MNARIRRSLRMFVGGVIALTAVGGMAAPSPADPASEPDKQAAAPALQPLGDTRAAPELPAATRSNPAVPDLKVRGAAVSVDGRHPEVEDWTRPVPKLPKERKAPADQATGGLFGLGATPTATRPDAMTREPEIIARERGAEKSSTSTGSARRVGDDIDLRLDAAIPVVQAVVGWTRSNRTAVLLAAGAVLALVWFSTRRTSTLSVATLQGVKPAQRRRRRRYRFRVRQHGQSRHHTSESTGSSPSRADAGASAAAGAGRSSGRQR